MAASDTQWTSVCERFRSARDLSEIGSQADPERDPFRSRYRARDLLREIHSAVRSLETDPEGGDAAAVDGGSAAGLRAAKLGVIEYYLAVNHIETEELCAGEEFLRSCVKLLERCTVTRENASVLIQARNQLGILWAGRGEAEKAQGFLETAESIYITYMKEDGQPPLDLVDHFVLEEDALTPQERTRRFEMAYTHTLYYLAQVYKNLEQFERAGRYCHSTLQRQLQLKQFTPLEWAINAATLSQYYITKTRYMEARHCLSAANVIADLAGEIPSEAAAKESEAECEKREQLLQKKAEIARCWIKYCLNLLQDAKKLLEDSVGELDPERQEQLQRSRPHEEEEAERARKSAVLFDSADASPLICCQEERVSASYPLTFSHARALFLTGQTYVTHALQYFCLDGHVTDHVEILQDHSALFKALAFFEEDPERRCKMHRRRVDLLEPVCRDLNARFYLLLRRQLQFELAETFSEMMDLKRDRSGAHAVKKHNHLCSASISYYAAFIDSVRPPGDELPAALEPELLRPTLLAVFRTGRLHGRLVAPGPADQLQNLRRSLECYGSVVRYCRENPRAAEALETELELSRQMEPLLAIRINRMEAGLSEGT